MSSRRLGADVERSYSRYYPDLESLTVIREDFLTQLEPGDQVCHARALDGLSGSLLGLWERPLCVGGVLLRPEFTGIVLPVSWEGVYLMNGHLMAANEAFAFDGCDGFVSRGKNRFLYALALEKSQLEKSLAALRGVGRESISLPLGPLHLPAAMRNELSRRFHAWLHADQRVAGEQVAGKPVMESLYQCLLEIHIASTPEVERSNSSWRRASRTVRLAMDEFARLNGHVSLADLCAAASVSRSTLYAAFQQVAGMAPLQYFRARGINDVHQQLTDADYRRGAVGEIAMRAGFTELGRFSAEYRKVYGVNPSVTLAQN